MKALKAPFANQYSRRASNLTILAAAAAALIATSMIGSPGAAHSGSRGPSNNRAASVNGSNMPNGVLPLNPQSTPTPQVWTVEKVAHISPLPSCGPSVEISGLVHDSMNQPAVSWGVLNRCTFPGVDQFWARKNAGAWEQFTIANYNGPNRRGFRGSPSLAMRADDNPFLVYADVGINDGVSCDGPLCPGVTTHLQNLGENQVGPGGIVEIVGSGRSSCTVYPRFAAQFTPSSLAPNWVTGLACSGNDSLRLNGVPVTDKSNLGFDYAVGPGGQNHIIFSDTDVYYNNGVAGSDLKIATINRFSGDVQIAADSDNKLHAIIRGYDSGADFDLGVMGYVTSTDGVIWTNPVFIDTTRTASRPAIALDNNGNPAVAYWRFGELRFAYLRNGEWSNVHVITVPNAPYTEQKRLQLEFDKNNVPTIAFFDPCSNNIWITKPATGSQSPVDLTLDISHSPDPLPPGMPLTYTIKVINNASREATHVIVTETLPSNVTLISASPAPVSQSGNTLYFDMGIVTPSSNCDVITIKVMPTSIGQVTNVVSVTGDDVDSNGDNNTVTDNAEVRPAECFPPRNGMVAWWMAEGDANDAQNPNGFPGTMKGAVTFAPGKVGQAFNLNGSDAYIEVPDDPSFYPSGSFSINAWVNTTTGGFIATKYECGGFCPAWANSVYFLYVGGGSGKIGFFIRDTAGNSQEIASSKVVADGTFHHIVGVRDSGAGTMTIYVDGVADASASLIANAPIRNDDGFYDPLIIGALAVGGSGAIQGHFKGLIDDVAYYNRALSAAEVQAIYTGPLCSTNQPPNVTNPGDQSSTVGESVSLQVVASDPNGDTLTYSASGLPTGLEINSATGLITGTLGSMANTHAVTVSVSDGSLNGSESFNWTINKLTPAFSNLSSPTITYGTASTTLSGVISAGSVIPSGTVSITLNGVTQSAIIQTDGSFSSSFVTGSLGVANSPYRVDYAYADDSAFNSADDNSTLTVLRADPALTWNNPSDIGYATPLSATQLNAIASVPGDFVYTPGTETVLNAGNDQTLSVNFTPTDAANYNSASATVLINVLKADPTISWTGPSDITYGTTLDQTQLNASANVPGTMTYTPSSGTLLNAGSGQTLSVSFTPTDSNNYNNAAMSVQLNVLKATPTIDWSNPADITYGTPLSATQLNASASVPGALDYTPVAGTVLQSGNNLTLSVDLTPADSVNYNQASASVHINVLKATPTVNVTGGTFSYDGNSHAATGTVTGVGGANLGAPSLTYDPGGTTAPRDAGSYSATGSFAGDDDYHAASGSASIVINRAGAIIILSNLTQNYDGSPKPVDAQTNPPGLSGLSITYDGSTTPPTNPGSYAVVASLNNPNYDAAAVTATLVIATAQSPTSVAYTGSTLIASGTPAVLSAVLSDASASTLTPIASRNLTLTLGSGPNAQSCTGVTDSNGSAVCSISSVTQPVGSGVVFASFAGDSSYLASSTSAPTWIFAGEACFVVDFREVTYFRNTRVLTSSDADIRTRNGITGGFDPSRWPYAPQGGTNKTKSRGTLFRIYGFSANEVGVAIPNADNLSITYTVTADPEINGAYYLDLGGPARVVICPSQLQTHLIGNGEQVKPWSLPGSSLQTDAQRNVPGIMLSHNVARAFIPERVRNELRALGTPLIDSEGQEGQAGFVNFIAFQLWGHGNPDYREFVDVNVRFIFDDANDRLQHYKFGFHTARNGDLETFAGCGYLDFDPGDDTVRFNDVWAGRNQSNPQWGPACGASEPVQNQKVRENYAVPLGGIQILPTVNIHDDTLRILFGRIRAVN